MSGLYNTMFGINPLAPTLLHLLAIDFRAVPRLRDAYLFERDGERLICILTRTGGNNRVSFARRADVADHDPTNDDLRDHPLFVSDEDVRLDSTYARFLFRLPETYRDALLKVDMETQQDFEPRFKKWQSDMDAGRTTPDTERAKEGGKKMFGSLLDKLNKE